MKTIGRKCGWVIPSKEQRVLKLLRGHTRQRDHEFVIKCPSVASRKQVRIPVRFAEEKLSAFEPCVRVQPGTEGLAA